MGWRTWPRKYVMSDRSADQLVSVVMPVHNALPYLDAAVRSILDQSHREIEFVVYDDGSTDGSAERLREWAKQDSRICLHEGQQNIGPAHSSNLVVERSTASLVARMDADDISHPERIARQLAIFASDKEAGLVGTLCDIIDANGRKLRGAEPWRLIRASWFAPFPHGSIMFKRELFDQVGGYRSQCEYWEDQDLVLRMAAQTEIIVLPQSLYMHRQSTASTRVASNQQQVERAVDLMYRSMTRLEQNRPYDDLLDNGPSSEKLDPRVFISLGSLVLWAGGKPHLLRRMLARAKLRLDAKTATSLVWASWASLSPATLRMFIRFLVRSRHSLTAVRGRPDRPVRWNLPNRRLIGSREH